MLKNILSLLLSRFYSKKESGEVAHQALPSTNSTYLFSNKSVSKWGTVSTGVAPYDGFLVLNANGDGTSDSASIFVSTPCVKSMIVFPFPSAGCSTWAPIAKGEAWAVQGSNAKQISLELCKTIGGGYHAFKRFVQKGVCLCLNLSFNCLQKPSSKVKNPELACRECRQLRRQSYPQQWTRHGELISLQQTVMSFLVGASHGCLEDLFRFGRAALCTITSKVRTVPQGSPLLPVSLSNLEKGGSLC